MKNNDLRKLVTIKKIDQIKSIPNADNFYLEQLKRLNF